MENCFDLSKLEILRQHVFYNFIFRSLRLFRPVIVERRSNGLREKTKRGVFKGWSNQVEKPTF